MSPGNEKSTRPGVDSSDSKLSADFEPGAAPVQQKSPITLESWLSLSAGVKQSRRKPKKSWLRKSGGAR